jgi:DNA-binding NtrC family response regulator
MSTILIVEDDRLKRLTLEKQLSDMGYPTISCENAFAALQKLNEEEIGIVVTDLKMPGMDGIAFLKEAKSKFHHVEFIVMTAYGSIETAVETIRLGAYDYLTKPFTIEELAIKLKHLSERQSTRWEVERLKAQLAETYQFHHLVAASKVMHDVFEKALLIADQDVPVLIQGETGTGKELLSQAMHYTSERKRFPFLPLSCAILNPSILESEIFGHEAGAFTGAIRQKKGRLELAGKGTLFLDDIDDISMDLQAKFLRVVQEKEYERVGGEKKLLFEARIICATKRDIRSLVAERKFREDLMYRLDVVHLDLPPLRARREDIPLLLSHFASKYRLEREFSPQSMCGLLAHYWPGNVRELQNVVLQICAMRGTGPVQVHELPGYLVEKETCHQPYRLNLEEFEHIDLPQIIEEMEQKCVQWAMIKAKGNQAFASELLNLPRTTLRRYITKIPNEMP